MTYNILHTYRMKDGTGETELVDVTQEASAEGFRVPVAITRAVHEAYVRIPAGVEGQTEARRLKDILSTCALEGTRQRNKAQMLFSLYVRNDERRLERAKLKCVCGSDEDGRPCLTILKADEA